MSSSNTDSTTDSVSAATSVSAVCTKLPVSSYPNIDSLSNAIDVDDLEEMDLRWQMTMLTMRARIFLQKTGRNLGDNRVTTMGFDMSKVECYNCYRKGHFARECKSLKDTRRIGGAEPHRRTTPVETSTSNALVSQCDGIESYDWSYQAEEEPANFALMAIPSSSSSNNEENIIMLKNEVEARDNFILTHKQKLKQAETERDDLKLKFEKFQSSSKSLTELIASQTNNKNGLGYLSSEDDSESVSLTCPSDRLSLSGRYHAVHPPITVNFMPPKPDLVFNTALLAVESDHSAFSVQVSPAKPVQAMSHTTESMALIIKDWVSDSEDEYKPNDPQNVYVQPIEVPILAATPKPTIKTSSSGKRKNRNTSFVCRSVDNLIKDCNFHVKPQTKPTLRNSTHRGCNKQYASFTKKYPQKHKVPAAVLLKSKLVSITIVRQGNPQYALKDKGVIDSGCSWHMTGNMSYLFDFQELNGGYVAFGGNPKGGKISGKRKIKIDFKLPDKSQVLLRVPRENNMYNVNLKDIVEAVNTACYVQNRVLVTKPHNKTPYELLHGRTPSIGFMRPFGCYVTILNTLDTLGKFEGKIDKGFLVGYSVNSASPTRLFDIDSLTKTMNYQPVTAGNQTNPKVNTAFDEKEHDAEKPESAVNLSPSRSALSGEKDDMTKKKDKGKSPAECFSEYRDLNAVFEDFFEDSSNDVSAASPIVPTAGKNYSNSANPISAADHIRLTSIIWNNWNPKGYIKLSKIQVGLKLCRKSFFSLKCRKFRSLFDLPHGKRAIGTKWFYRNKKDERGIVVRNKARLIAQGHTQEEGIDYEEVFAPDPDGEVVDVHIYKSMIGSLMYLTSSRPDIMFAVYICARFQVTPKVSPLHAVKRFFRYLKGKPNLGLWYPKDSPFDLVAYLDSEYAGASLDRKSTTGGCQFLGCKLISWQCKKQTVVATSSTVAEYVAGASCCAQML
nr:uncharacterized mitochondrial protein AtMg00810-like [Tanacetum cinerariifolium]